ncbi:glycosyltransferase family 1 protein [Bizionia argentinensis JUB59]|uniref:Glycosyltransferase family 1 protein n=1 Tax=Bizionia argentinensis JUB59 TaxID=1046627 RepID=G2E9A9_9FLAO|nr:glycosyltransferase family 4 protein [Bizionia argentinensis]EGV44987.1 glycosyltransferase family 1 protein [Bizionia argentinensis JUB59]
MAFRSKKICLVGGEDVHKRINLSQYLNDAGFEVTILGTSVVSFPDNITYYNYPLNRSLSLISDYKTIKWYRTFFTENRFDVIHTFDTKPAFLTPLALLKTKTPITRTITGLGTVFISQSLLNKSLRLVYNTLHLKVRNRVFKTVFQNNDDKDLFLKNRLVSQHNFELIYSSGIELKDYNRLAKRSNKRFTFICVARLVYEKGITYLLEAAKICHEKGHDFKFLIVGPLEENSKRLNAEILNNYKNYVEFLGERSDVEKLLLSADAFVLPTFREGFARVLLEAAAVGLPIISTNVTGVREFAKHNQEALLVSSKNTEELVNACIKLASCTELANKLVENALKRVERFSLKNVSKQYIGIFEEAINQQTI